MSNKELVGEVIIAENGALKTFASYYKGHLNLQNYSNMSGEHLCGFTGPETRIVSKRLMAHIIGDRKQTAEQPVNIPETLASGILEVNQETIIIS